jgi:hypothetical protein
VAPLGALAFTIGPQWPLRVASVVFLAGVVVALNLPPRADSDPPEVVPKAFHLPGSTAWCTATATSATVSCMDGW